MNAERIGPELTDIELICADAGLDVQAVAYTAHTTIVTIKPIQRREFLRINARLTAAMVKHGTTMYQVSHTALLVDSATAEMAARKKSLSDFMRAALVSDSLHELRFEALR